MFIDADSELSPELLGDVLDRIQAGQHIGLGSLVALDQMDTLPRSAGWFLSSWTLMSTKLNWAAGSFVVCRADAFHELGGFSEELYAAEEIDFSIRAKRYARKAGARFEVLRDHPLTTSSRKLHLYSQRELFTQLFRLLVRPRGALRNRDGLAIWYDGRR